MSWLLDTCALSEYVRKAPAPEVIRWLDEQDEASLFISVISLGEIEKGILKLRASDPRRSQKLTAWLGKVEQRFAGHILLLDAAALHVWAQIAARAELSGQSPAGDGWVAHGYRPMPRPDRGHPQRAGLHAVPASVQPLGAVDQTRWWSQLTCADSSIPGGNRMSSCSTESLPEMRRGRSKSLVLRKIIVCCKILCI